MGSALTLVNCIGFSITVVSLSLMQWMSTMVPPQYLLVLLAAGPAVGLVCMKSLVGKNRDQAFKMQSEFGIQTCRGSHFSVP